jgi:hypothetical protein
MNKILNNAAILIAIVVIAVVSACTTIKSKNANVNIERNSSVHASIYNIAVTSTESTVTVSGTLHKKHRKRTYIPGHVDIMFVSSDGALLKRVKTDYYSRSYKSRTSMFRAEVPLALPEGSTVYLTHR